MKKILLAIAVCALVVKAVMLGYVAHQVFTMDWNINIVVEVPDIVVNNPDIIIENPEINLTVPDGFEVPQMPQFPPFGGGT